MNIKPIKSKLKAFDSELGEDVLNLKTLDTNIIIKTLEANIDLRETPIDKRKIVLK